MNIIVSHVYSNDNKGDAAILSVLLQDIRRAFDNPRITILTLDPIQKGETFENTPVENGFMYYASNRYKNRILQSLYSLFVVVSTLLWACIKRYMNVDIPLPRNLHKLVRSYSQADLVIPVGGGYVRGKKGLMESIVLFFIIYPFLFSSILNKITVGYTQSVGPFGNIFQEFIARFSIKKLDGIIAREKITLDLLKKWGVTQNVFLSTDAGFLFAGNIIRNLHTIIGIQKEKMLIGITVRTWLSKEKQARYEKTIARIADHIIKKYNAAIIFIPQVTADNHNDDDRESGARVYSQMKHTQNAYIMNERYDHGTIKALYGGLDYLIGTRFHSVIFALTSYVPCIAIEYEYKTRGIMNELGLKKWVVNIEDVQEKELEKLFDALVLKRERYTASLKKNMPTYIERAHQSIYFVRDVYKQELIS